VAILISISIRAFKVWHLLFIHCWKCFLLWFLPTPYRKHWPTNLTKVGSLNASVKYHHHTYTIAGFSCITRPLKRCPKMCESIWDR